VNPVRQALRDRLAADSDLLGLLATPESIYHRQAPQDAETPYVIFARQDGRRDLTFGSHIQWDKWLVKAVTRTEKGYQAQARAEEIDARIEALLDQAKLNIEGRSHLYLRRESDVDFPEPDGTASYRHVGGIYGLATEPA
jgi:hypothetical protein